MRDPSPQVSWHDPSFGALTHSSLCCALARPDLPPETLGPAPQHTDKDLTNVQRILKVDLRDTLYQ